MDYRYGGRRVKETRSFWISDGNDIRMVRYDRCLLLQEKRKGEMKNDVVKKG